MIHVGNDIVDLKTQAAKGKSTDTRFMRKVLTPHEKQAVLHASDPDQYLWALWASKESAYKAVSKSYPQVPAAPKRYPVFLTSKPSAILMNGVVHGPKGIARVRLFLNQEYVHCIGLYSCSHGLNDICWGLEKILPCQSAVDGLPAESQSAMVRRMAAKSIARQLNLDPEKIQIKRIKNDLGLGPPMVYINGSRSTIDISLSHHGRFNAYAAWNLINPSCNIEQPGTGNF
ncbi:MAG: 4'-phosphopantetheinyl transferase superfamily protein [Desulfobacterales bacterium]